MNRNLDRRVVKLEDRRRELRGGAYIVWAASKDGMADAIRAAINGGYVQQGDPTILGIWSASAPIPFPRWITKVSELSDEELQILRDIVAASETTARSEADATRIRLTDYTDGELLALLAKGYRGEVDAVMDSQCL